MDASRQTVSKVCAIAAMAVVLAACGGAASAPAEDPTAPAPLGVAPTATASPTSTPDPTPSPEPTPVAGLDEACAAIAEFRETGPLIQRLAETAFGSYETGDYDPWQEAADAMNQQLQDVTALLDEVPNEDPYAEWKESALGVMLGFAGAIIQYDTGILDLDLAEMEAGTESMTEAADAIATMNEAAAAFEGDC